MSNSARCQRCEKISHLTKEQGWLHLHLPTQHSLGKVIQLSRQANRQLQQRGSLVSLLITEQDFEAFLSTLMAGLTTLEKEDTKVLFQPVGKQMELEDYFEMQSLQRFLGKCQSDWLITLIEENMLYSIFQPIVCAEDARQIFAYECLLRGLQDGAIVTPNRLFEVARHAGLITQLDLAARLAAIRGAARYQIKEQIFINFTPSAIYDPKHCLQSTMNALDELGLQREQVVFEIIESERINDIKHLRMILDFYRQEGFGVALDDLGAGYSSLNMLHELRPDYVKLDIGLIRQVDQDQYKGFIAQKLLETAHLLGVKTIAEGIETEQEYQWLREHGANYLQGYYFAKPAEIPPRRQFS